MKSNWKRISFNFHDTFIEKSIKMECDDDINYTRLNLKLCCIEFYSHRDMNLRFEMNTCTKWRYLYTIDTYEYIRNDKLLIHCNIKLFNVKDNCKYLCTYKTNKRQTFYLNGISTNSYYTWKKKKNRLSNWYFVWNL